MAKLIFILLSIPTSFFMNFVDSAKILYLWGIGCSSTTSMHHTISKILLNQHHEIITISPLPFDNPPANYTDLSVHDDFFKFSDKFSIEDNLQGIYVNRKLIYEIQNSNCENIYRNNKLIKTLQNIKIDLVMMELDHSECFLPLVAQFNVPIIGIVTTFFLFPELDGVMGNPMNPSYVPCPMNGFSTRMNFFQRLQNTKDYVLHMMMNWYYTNEADIIVAKHLKNPTPVRELYDRISLVFANGHYGILSKPMAHGTVNIAGIHLKNISHLPKEIQTFIDDSTEGVVYLSLGSVAKFSGLPNHIHDSFANVLKNLPYRVIWRHDSPEMISNLSKNILVGNWLPQNDILAHPKVILFISHAGLFSLYEAIYNAVPMLTFPVMYDQTSNAAVVQNLEIGEPLNLHDFNERSLHSKIDQVVKNEKYRKNMKRLSSIFKDRPMSPQDTLIYWVEYVLRHENVSYLKPEAVRLSFHQYLLLDVIFVLIAMLIFISCIIYFTSKMIISLFKSLLRVEQSIKKYKTS